MSDYISRQAAIDAIEDTDWYHQNKNKDMVHGANSAEHQAWYKAEDIYEALRNVPSAQPDTTKLAQAIWTKVCKITDTEGLQHEVIHHGDLKDVIYEVTGWMI